MNALTKAVARAVKIAPCSVRKLAAEAGVSHAILVLIKKGERPATPAVAKKIAAALDRWGARCASAAEGIRKSDPRRRR